MTKNIMTMLFLFLTRAVQKVAVNKEAYQEISQLKLRLLYLRTIKTCRQLFLSSLGMGISLIFLFCGLVLFHATLFLYAPISLIVKMWIGFGFAAVYVLIAAKVFSFVFAEGEWVKMFHAQDMFKKLDDADRIQGANPLKGR